MSGIESKRNYHIDPENLPYKDKENLECFAPPYTPESFTADEIYYLAPFFTNLTGPVFIAKNLPEEVIGALSSRYSRSTESMRRTFLTEYVGPILNPEKQKDWAGMGQEKRDEARETRRRFLEFVDFMNTNQGIELVVNVQRARGFFKRWLAEYGDDSIAEMGGVHLMIEGLSNVATKEIEDKRIGVSPLEKSSRYVSFANKRPDGSYQYVIPGEVKGSPLEQMYCELMDKLFDTYANLSEKYLAYIKEVYPKGEDETETSFERSRGAKRFDDIRDLLPFATQTNVALFGNGRAFEDLVNRLMCHPLGELRYWGQMMLKELEKIVPSFVERTKTERGAIAQQYRRNIHELRQEMIKNLLPTAERGYFHLQWVRLIDYTPDADVAILSAFLFSAESGASLGQIRELVSGMSKDEREKQLALILEERKFGNPDSPRHEARFRKVPRAFENAHYTFEIWGRGGDYRDLHRHRPLTQERQRFITAWGYDLEPDVVLSPFFNEITTVLELAEDTYRKLHAFSPDIAQYAVPFGYIQHWYMTMTAREVYWMVELRTGSQGRPHYREICQQIAKLAMEASPAVFQGLMCDFGDYSLARRESEKRIENKLKGL